MLLGIIGTRCSGKSSVANILKEQGFTVISLSEVLREKARERGLEVKQETLYSIANELRKKFGMGVLMEEALNKIAAEPGDYVIDTVRNPVEIEMLKSKKDAFMVGVDASFSKRYMRACDRQQQGKQEWAATEEQFRKHDVADTGDPSRPNIHTMLDSVDVVIDNSETMDVTEKAVLAMLEEFRKTIPSSDEKSDE